MSSRGLKAGDVVCMVGCLRGVAHRGYGLVRGVGRRLVSVDWYGHGSCVVASRLEVVDGGEYWSLDRVRAHGTPDGFND